MFSIRGWDYRGRRLGLSMAGAALAFAVLLAVTVVQTPARAASARATTWCTPYALTPHVYSYHAAYGDGEVYCGTLVGFDYQLDLRNNAGQTLVSKVGTNYGLDGWWETVTATVGCSGAILHSFLYINQAGTGASDTSGTNSDCSY